MSAGKRKGRLSLKRKNGPPTTSYSDSAPQPTILSMFKKQRNRDEETAAESTDKEPTGDSDVVITGVTQESIDQESDKETDISDNKNKGATPDVTTVSKRKRSLSLVNKDKEKSILSKFSSLSEKRKQEVSAEKIKRKGPNTDCTAPYKLRKHKTVPVIDITSDSDSDGDSSDHVEAKHTLVTIEALNDLPSSGSDFQATVRSKKRKRTVKRSHTADEITNVKSRGKVAKRAANLDKEKPIDLSEECGRKSTGKKQVKTKKKSAYTESEESSDVSSPEVEIISCTKSSTSESNKSTYSAVKGRKYEKKKDTINSENVEAKPSRQKSLTFKSTDVDIEPDKSKPSSKELKQSTIHGLFKKKSTEGLPVKSKRNSIDGTNTDSKSKDDDHVIGLPASKGQSKPFKDLKKKGKVKDNDHNGGTIAEKSKTMVGNEGNENVEVLEETGENEDAEEKTEVVYAVPYYLENFRTILDSVLADEENARLFNEIDMAYVAGFNNLTEPCQKLYVRLFSRKLAWLPMSRLKYPEISSDIPALVDEMNEAGLLHMGDRLDDLKIILKILAAPDLKTLAKSFQLNATGTKDRTVELLLKKSQQSSIATMFTGGAGVSTERTMLTRAMSYLGKVCRLEETARAVFIRLLMLFSLYHTNFDEESGGGGQNQLFQMLMANIGRVVYPTYTIERKTPVFQDRTALVRFEMALQFELDLQHEMEKGRWGRAHEVYTQAKAVGSSLSNDKHIHKWDSKLPEFLRLYTARSVYTRIDSLGVEILQRLKQYREAVQLLEELITQDLYCVHHRGHWYERLALNLDAHLKSQAKSLDVVKRGLSEKRVHTGRRLALYERAKKICEAPKSKFADKLAEIDHEPVLPTPEVTIEGMVISDATSMGIKYQFIMSGDIDQTTLCGVEELVLEHYKNNGYPEGLHAEGSIISNLFVLFFWDILFMSVPDVFHGPFQTAPLDLHTQDFYKNRAPALDKRLDWLQEAEEEELVATVADVWEKNSGVMCQGINWERFDGPETHQGLVRCMGGKVISGMLDRFVRNPRHTRSGFPDLTLWNTETKVFKICEVKGPNDRLSYKQILWIDYLLKLGVDAEVCYVKAVGSKKLKPATSKT